MHSGSLIGVLGCGWLVHHVFLIRADVAQLAGCKLLGLQTLGCGGRVKHGGPWQYDQRVLSWMQSNQANQAGLGWVG
jgi:hypothetical protein